MEILKSAVILVIGFVLLIKGADYFVEGMWDMSAIVAWSVRGRFNSPSPDNQSGTSNPTTKGPNYK